MIVGDEYIELCAKAWRSSWDWDDSRFAWLTWTMKHRRGAPYCYLHNNSILYMEFGLRHRLDGPAEMRSNPRVDEWFIYGIEFTEEYEEC